MAGQVDERLFQSFAFYGVILLIKMSLMSGLTSINRIRRKVFANPEDAKAFGGGKVVLNDPVVERIRRCHLNDLENILLFVILGLLYCFTNPSYTTAVWIFRIFTIARLLHFYVYLNELQQPRRFLTFLIGYLMCWVMIVQIFRSDLVKAYLGMK